MKQLPLSIALRESATFENYFPGPNREVVSAVERLVGEPGGLIYLWGGEGVGRSHLLQAACHLATERGVTSTYLPLTDAWSWPVEMVEGLETLGLVCLDDIGAVAGVEAWEEALFHLFNRLRDTGGALLVSADAAPATVGLGLADLQSRLSWGLTLKLQALNDEQKQQAIELLAYRRGLILSSDAATYLLRHAPRGQATLFALLAQLDEASLAEQRRLTIPFIKSILGTP